MSVVTHSPPSLARQKAVCMGQAAQDKQAEDVLVLEVGHLTSIADYFVLASGETERQVRAIATFIEKEISSRFHSIPQVEGQAASKWILLDFGDVIAHIFKNDVRQYYSLEKMWADAPQIPVPESRAPSRPSLRSPQMSSPAKMARLT